MKAKKVLKVLGIILLILLVLILILVIVVHVNAKKNRPVMNETAAKGLELVQKDFTVTKLDAGDYTDMKFYGIMKFHVDQYRVEELGNLSVMTADMGFMQMVSFLITPYEKNLPVCTLDYMYILGSRTSYTEFYDLAADTESDAYRGVQDSLKELASRYADLEDSKVEEHWYDTYLTVFMHKKLKRADDARNKEMFCDALQTYLDAAKATELNSPEDQAKQVENTQQYCDGLIEKGGVSTDLFKKVLGEEKTHEFFDRVFFGTDLYRQ